MNIVFALELLITSKNAQLEIITKAFADGHLDDGEKDAFEEYVMNSFKNGKTALIAQGKALPTESECSCSCHAHKPSTSAYPGSSKAPKVSKRGASTSTVTHTQKAEEASSTSPETTTKKRASSNSFDYIESPCMEAVNTPSPVDPSKRRRYPTNHFSPSNPGNIKETAEFKISDKLRQESAVVAEAESRLPRTWKRAEGIGMHIGQRVFVNPMGRGYKAKCNPVLGEDFFLDPRDVLAYLAQFEDPTAEIDTDAQDPEAHIEQAQPRTPYRQSPYARAPTQSESPVPAPHTHHQPENAGGAASSSAGASKQAAHWNAFDTDVDNDGSDSDLESDFDPTESWCGPSSMAPRASGSLRNRGGGIDSASECESESEHEKEGESGAEECKSPTTYPAHTERTDRMSAYSALARAAASVVSHSASSALVAAPAPAPVPMSSIASPMCRPNVASAAPRHSAEGIRQVPQLAHPQVAVKVEEPTGSVGEFVVDNARVQV